MGDNSNIEWTDATWNPVVGCSRVSPGCDHCYAIRDAHRMAFNPNPKIGRRYAGLTEQRHGHIVNQCWLWQVPCFVKQLGERWARVERHDVPDRHGSNWDYWPQPLRVHEFPAVGVRT